MKSLLALALAVLPVFAEEASPGLKIPESAWHSAWLARKRVKEGGEALKADAADLLKQGNELLGLKKKLKSGSFPLAKRLRAEEAEMAELEKKEGEILAKIRGYGATPNHAKDELKSLQGEQEQAQRKLREQRTLLDLDLRPALRRELADFGEGCRAYAKRVNEAFRQRGLIPRYAFDKRAKDLVRRNDYGFDAEGHTHCATFATDFAKSAFGYEGLPAKSANDIADFLKEGKQGWSAVWDGTPATGLQDGLKKAQELANAGYFVLAVWRSPAGSDLKGHVAVVLPGELKKSALWGLDAPDTAQAGRIVFERGPLPVGFEEHRDILLYVRKP